MSRHESTSTSVKRLLPIAKPYARDYHMFITLEIMIYNATISCEKLEFTNFTIPVRNGKLSASSRVQAQRWNVTALNISVHTYVHAAGHIQDPGTLAPWHKQKVCMYKTIYI